MARNEEKAQGLMNRWTQMKMDLAGPQRGKRPYLASECDNLSDCEYWRRQIIKEIQRLVGDIQNAGLGEHALRDMNDDINKKIREKRHWERQIKALGGPDYGVQKAIYDADGQQVSGGGGYLYFGATKNLPGVRELFEKEAPQKKRRNRHEIYKNINSDYYGYRDEDDGVLVAAEAVAEAKLRTEAAEAKANARKRKAGQIASSAPDDAATETVADNVEISSSDDEAEKAAAAGGLTTLVGEDATTSANVRAHVPVPDQEAIEQLILARRRLALLSKYASANLQADETNAKSLLNVKR
eukprot:INCI9414.2.p2 GENE.INCI9414.2~~INCI9414.2.p2  ORF type:complete len:298 (+),score=75.84 INCI9414.2:173-1066(+)